MVNAINPYGHTTMDQMGQDTLPLRYEPYESIDVGYGPSFHYLVAHIHNRGDVYHMTRQMLLDSAIKHDTCCLFYRMIAMEQEEFNTIYCAFATQIPRSEQEVDIYLNVDPLALASIVDYVQSNKLMGMIQPHAIEQLASMFGMPALVQKVRDMAD